MQTKLAVSARVLISGFVALAVGVTCWPSDSQSVPPSSSARAALTESLPSPPISDDDLAALDAAGDHLSLVVPSNQQIVSATSALGMSASVFAFLRGGGKADGMDLAYLTDDQFVQHPVDSSGNPIFDAPAKQLVKDRLVWMLTFSDVPVFKSGPLSAATSAPQPQPKAHMWVAVDAVSGNVIGGRTFIPQGA